MKFFAITLMLALSRFGTVCNARGAPTSSFVPHNSQEPHATLSHKHSPKRSGHNGGGHNGAGHGTSEKGGHHANPQTADHSTRHTPRTN